MSIFSQVFGGGFDSNTIEPSTDFDVLPPGKYPVVIEKSEIKATKKGDGHYLELCVSVTDGAVKGRKLWPRMNIDNPSEIAQRIALQQLASLCKAVGIAVIRDENELLGKSCIANVKAKDDQNEIRSWSSISGTVQGKPESPVNPASTQQLTQGGGQGAVQPTAGNKPPWAR